MKVHRLIHGGSVSEVGIRFTASWQKGTKKEQEFVVLVFKGLAQLREADRSAKTCKCLFLKNKSTSMKGFWIVREEALLAIKRILSEISNPFLLITFCALREKKKKTIKMLLTCWCLVVNLFFVADKDLEPVIQWVAALITTWTFSFKQQKWIILVESFLEKDRAVDGKLN